MGVHMGLRSDPVWVTPRVHMMVLVGASMRVCLKSHKASARDHTWGPARGFLGRREWEGAGRGVGGGRRGAVPPMYLQGGPSHRSA